MRKDTRVEDSDDDSYHALNDSLDESDEGMQRVDLKLQTKLSSGHAWYHFSRFISFVISQPKYVKHFIRAQKY